MNDQIRKGLQKIHAITSAVLEASEGEPNEDVITGLKWLRTQMLPENVCRTKWVAGLASAHGAPQDGELCQFKKGHGGHHSFVVAALTRGWKLPDHLTEPPPATPE